MASIFKRKHKVKLSNGKSVVKQSRRYYTRLTDVDGLKRTIPLYRDKVASQHRAAQLHKEIDLAKAGVVDGSIKIGTLELVEINYICQKFNICRQRAFTWLDALRIPKFDIEDRAYFSIESLEITLRVISETGTIFPMPSRLRKRNNRPENGLRIISNKIFKRVCDVQTQITNRLNERIKEWQKEKEELQKVKQLLKKARQTLRARNR